LVALYHRLLLATLPPVYALILGRFLRRPVAVLASLLSMTWEMNEIIAGTALTDLTYVALGLLSVYALFRSLTGDCPLIWLAAAGLLAASKTLIRVTGFPIGLMMGAAWFALDGSRIGVRFARLGVYIAPLLAVMLGISAYNQATSGHFAPSLGGGITFFTQYGVFFEESPDTPAIREYARLFPDAPPEYALNSGSVWLAQYRFTASGRGDVFDFGALLSRAVQEMLLAEPGMLLGKAAQGVGVMLLDPLRGSLPSSWLLGRTPTLHSALDTGIRPSCNVQYAFGAVVEATWCKQYADLRVSAHWRPPWLAEMPGWVRRAAHLLTVSLAYRIRQLLWPFYWGIAAFGCMAVLVTCPPTRRLAVLLGVSLLAEFAMIIAFTNGLETRYLFYLHPTYLILTWLALSLLLDRIEGQQTP
jgi:hypothetical protein